MPVRVLITTNIRSLGELMQQALQETGRYWVELVDGVEPTLARAGAEHFALAILDFGAVPDPLELITDLLDVSPDTRIVAMPSSAEEEDAFPDPMVVDAWLSMPFYLPNLIDTLAEVVDDTDIEALEAHQPERLPFPSAFPTEPISQQPAPEWLQDVNRVAQHLTRLSLESAAQAALITRGSQLWAYAGQLPQPAAEELARAVGHYWNNGSSDLARFIRLDATHSEYMMYATSLGDDYLLALAFETEMPFSEMRTHAADLAKKLFTLTVDDAAVLGVDSTPRQETASGGLTPVDEPAVVEFTEEGLSPMSTDWPPDQDAGEGKEAVFEELLASLDASQPDGLETDQAGASVPPPLSLDDHEEALDLSLAGTRPTVVDQTEPPLEPGALEADNLTLHNLRYACVLVPRLPQHHLVGDLADFLTQWVSQLSLAFGWRLEHLAIRPEFLHWVAVVPPDSSPGTMAHDIRRETSQNIFSEFPRLKRENPSGEFWASGFLIVNGRDPLSRQMVQEFIGSVRTRQGAQ